WGMWSMRYILVAAFALTLGACASSAMKSYVGQSVSEAYFDLGRPESIFDLPDGRRAFQFRWGGGAVPVAGYSNTNIAATGSGYAVTTTSMPAMIVESEGCLVTLIARQADEDFLVEEYRIPQRLVC